MKKWNYKTLALICGGMMVVAFAGCALAGSPTIEAGKGQIQHPPPFTFF